MRKYWISLSVLASLALLSLGISALTAGDGKEAASAVAPAAFKPVAPLEVMMEKVGEIFYDKIEKSIKAKDAKGLKSFKNDSLFLAEIFNMVRFHTDAMGKRVDKDWGQWASTNIDLLKQFSNLSEKGDFAALAAAFKKIDDTCEACHGKYKDK